MTVRVTTAEQNLLSVGLAKPSCSTQCWVVLLVVVQVGSSSLYRYVRPSVNDLGAQPKVMKASAPDSAALHRENASEAQ